MLSISSSFPKKGVPNCHALPPPFRFVRRARVVHNSRILFIYYYSFIHSTLHLARVRVNCTSFCSSSSLYFTCVCCVRPYPRVFDFTRSSQSIAISEKWSFHHFHPQPHAHNSFGAREYKIHVNKIRMINMYDSANFLSSYCTDIPFFFLLPPLPLPPPSTSSPLPLQQLLNVLESTLLGIQWWKWWWWRCQGHAYGILTFHWRHRRPTNALCSVLCSARSSRISTLMPWKTARLISIQNNILSIYRMWVWKECSLMSYS